MYYSHLETFQHLRLGDCKKGFTCGGESSTMGKRVQADIDQSEGKSMLLASAASIGRRSGAQNAAATSRRSTSVGKAISAIVAGSGRAANKTKMMGAAT